MIRTRLTGPFFGIVVLSLICTACYKSPESAPNSDLKQLGSQTLLVLPFQDFSKAYGENVSVQCRLCGKMFTTARVEPEAAQYLTQQLLEMIEKLSRFELIPASQGEGVISALLQEPEKEMSELDLYLKTGESLGAEAVLSGHVYRFRQREGTEYSVGLPASVAFHLDMIRVRDGRVIWAGHFNETQRSLSEDLFGLGTFIRRKGRWITAEELAVYGLERVLGTIPSP